MPYFTLEMLAEQCGVSMPNLRAWQRCGLISPLRGEDGHRYFEFSHLMRVELIVGWINQGVALEEIGRLLKGEQFSPGSRWKICQENLLAALEKPQPEKARSMLRKLGRELPASALLDSVLIPLRLWLDNGSSSQYLTRRALLDTLIVEYAAFVMQALRKRPAPTLTIIPLCMRDPLEVWLAALRYGAEGFRIDVLAFPVPLPDLTQFSGEHTLLWSDAPPSGEVIDRITQWRREGRHILTAGPGFSGTSRSKS
ncbi:transcriptional regulator [Salmonella enterica subsp. enterica serovar Choleraesuis]|nr:transcriptional regulator [Salmonella enterica subsp. enterica serovar Choleraesuis]